MPGLIALTSAATRIWFGAGGGSYERIVARLGPLLGSDLRVSARLTVTPRHTALRATLEHLMALGFHSVGFSPMLASPNLRNVG